MQIDAHTAPTSAGRTRRNQITSASPAKRPRSAIISRGVRRERSIIGAFFMLNASVGADPYGPFAAAPQHDGRQGDDGGDHADQPESDGIPDGVQEIHQEFFVILTID